jgi:hypothetical protein
MKSDWQYFLDGFVKYAPIVISILALIYARKKDKLLYTTKFFPEIRSFKLSTMDLFLRNLGPGMAYDISVSAFFFRFHDTSNKFLGKSRNTLSKRVVYTLEHLSAGEKTGFSIDSSRLNDNKISSLFKWELKLEWRGFDSQRHSILFVFDNDKKRFVTANIFERLHLLGQRFIHTNLKKI